MCDPHSPPAGEAEPATVIHAHIEGCYDVGTLTLRGFTLISNNDLVALEALREAVGKLVKARGRFHTEQNYGELAALYAATKGKTP